MSEYTYMGRDKDNPIYRQNDIPINFEVMVNGKGAGLSRAKIIVYTDKKGFVFTDQAKVVGNEVRYIIKKNTLPASGAYILDFEVYINRIGLKSHLIKLLVKDLPVKEGKHE